MSMPGRAFAARHETSLFIILAFASSWCALTPALLDAVGWVDLDADAAIASHLLGALGPITAAIIAVSWARGRRGLVKWAVRFDPGRAPLGWALAAGAAPLAFAAVGLAVALFAGVTGPDSWRVIVLNEPFWRLNLLIALAYGIFEEPAWRGFLLQRLAPRHGVANAAIMTTGGWLVCHAPVFLYRQSVAGAFDALMYSVSLLAGAWMLAWLYVRSGGAVWVCIIFHVVFGLSVLALIAVSPVAVGAMNAALIIVGALLAAHDFAAPAAPRLTQVRKPAQ
jgi:hypothetical protein